MTRDAFLQLIDDVLEQPAGTIRGTETLTEFSTWDSVAVVSLIALIHSDLGVVVQPRLLRECKTVADVLALVGEHLEK